MNTDQKMPLSPQYLRKARHKAWLEGFKKTSQEKMETMWRNGSDVKPNPFLNGELILVGCSEQRAYLASQKAGKNSEDSPNTPFS